MKTGDIKHQRQFVKIVKSFTKNNREKILMLSKKYETPFYVFDKQALQEDLENFVNIFSTHIPNFHPFYAYKINNYRPLVKEALLHGYGLDVASGVELTDAIKLGCKNILYYSPGKKNHELLYAVKHTKYVRIHVDSFLELDRLGTITNNLKKHITIGVRIHVKALPQWVKFGIDIDQLRVFWKQAYKYPYIHIQGIHFHASRNKDAVAYVESIKELADQLSHFSKQERETIKYIDFGGGFEPYESEGYYPYEFSKDSHNNVHSSYDDVKRRFSNEFKLREAIELKKYASAISKAIHTYLEPLITPDYYAEPGRIICNRAMHIVLSIVDIKNTAVSILDGGINMVGWQRYMYEYFPAINLTRPSDKEIINTMYGNLCTTRDLWGYACYAKDMNIGDVVTILNQGALTYSIAQNWIQNIPNVYTL